MKIDGKFHCGQTAYEAEIDPGKVLICHCTDCQTLSSTAFRIVAPALPGSFKLLFGDPKTYIKTAESGAKRAMVFYPECGTQLYGTNPGDGPKQYSLRVGAMAQREALPPKAQIWCRSEQPWIDTLATLPRSETNPSF